MQLRSHTGLVQVLSYPMFAGTHFTYPQWDGGLSQPQARLSWEWVLNLGPVTWQSTALPSTKWCAFIQSFEQSRCISASWSGFPENSGLKFDQFKSKCCCCRPAGSWNWICCCCCCCCCCCWFCCGCHGFGKGTPSSLSAIFI